MMPTAALRLLVVEDEPAFSSAIRRYFEHQGCTVIVTRDAIGALRSHRANPADVALIDLALPGADGLSLLRDLRDDAHAPECIVVTGRGTIDNAVAATRSAPTLASSPAVPPLSLTEEPWVCEIAFSEADTDVMFVRQAYLSFGPTFPTQR